LEGPRRTPDAVRRLFLVHGDFEAVEHECGECRGEAGSPLRIRFTNPIDPTRFDPRWVEVEENGEFRRADSQISGSILEVHAEALTSSVVRVRLAPELTDAFGQPLGRPLELRFAQRFRPQFRLPGFGSLPVALDPAGPPRFDLRTRGIQRFRATLRVVSPAEYLGWQRGLGRNGGDEDKRPPTVGRVVASSTVVVTEPSGQEALTPIDLRPALKDGVGNLVLELEALAPRGSRRVIWLVRTRLNLATEVTEDAIEGWVTGLEDGAPVSGVELLWTPSRSVGQPRAAVTDASGRARIPRARARGFLIAKKAADAAFGGEVGELSERPRLVWHVLDDRGLYQPGEVAHLVGWVRALRRGQPPTIPAIDIEYTAQATEGTDLGSLVEVAPGVEVTEPPEPMHFARGSIRLDAYGRFDVALELPRVTGDAWISFTAKPRPGSALSPSEGYFSHSLRVQSFRRAEFTVGAGAQSARSYVGAPAIVTATAAYYSGSALAGAEVRWSTGYRQHVYSPPGWATFSFGAPLPDRFARLLEPELGAEDWLMQMRIEARGPTWIGQSDRGGAHRLALGVDGDPRQPIWVLARAGVVDVNGKSVEAASEFMVHPARNYVGVHLPESTVLGAGPVEARLIVVDVDGRVLPGSEIALSVERLGPAPDLDRPPVILSAEELHAVSATAPIARPLEFRAAGPHRLRAIVRDETGHHQETIVPIEVLASSLGQEEPSWRAEPMGLRLSADRAKHRPGETAMLHFSAPFAPASGLLTVQGGAHRRVAAFRVSEREVSVPVSIAADDTPGLDTRIDVFGVDPRAGTPRRVSGTIELPVVDDPRHLVVQVSMAGHSTAAFEPTDPPFAPGGQGTAVVRVLRADGRPAARAEVSLIVADEAVLAATGHRYQDPHQTFYPAPYRPEVSFLDSSLLAFDRRAGRYQKDVLGLEMFERLWISRHAASASLEPKTARGGELPAERHDFSPLAAFVPAAVTDSKGLVQIPISLPDTLTRYRVVAIAADLEQAFGVGETQLVVSLPVALRPSLPLVLHQGDELEVPVVAVNAGPRAITASVAARGSGLEILGPRGMALRIPPHARAIMPFRARATELGATSFQVASAEDQARVTVEVRAHESVRSDAHYGVLDHGAVALPLAAEPGDLFELRLSASAKAGLEDAISYLDSYPHQCSEQLASGILALLGDSRPGAPARIARALKALRANQRPDGGFGFWPGSPSEPFVSVHAAHALVRATNAGHAISPAVLEAATAYLEGIARRIPADFAPRAREAILAYAAYVRELAGAPLDAPALRALATRPELSIEAVGWLLSATARTPGFETERAFLRKRIEESAEISAGRAHLRSAASDPERQTLSSELRVDAVALEGLLRAAPNHDLIPKLVAGLLSGRAAERWATTQETGWAVLALGRYFDTFERQPPHFAARAWLGGRMLAEAEFVGRRSEARANLLAVPLSGAWSPEPGDPLFLAKDGPGRLYYRYGLRSLISDPRAELEARGFALERSFVALQDPNDVSRDAEGAWHIRVGARVASVLEFETSADRFHVALYDQLPAGLEPLAAATEWWVEHGVIRADGVSAFAAHLPPGHYRYGAPAVAATRGVFHAPASYVEEMYAPESFGRAAGALVRVE
jgi:uncharacterized protein YfaS (alpha-2-macroglobulin family)